MHLAVARRVAEERPVTRRYQEKLQGSLMYLASIADAQQPPPAPAAQAAPAGDGAPRTAGAPPRPGVLPALRPVPRR